MRCSLAGRGLGLCGGMDGARSDAVQQHSTLQWILALSGARPGPFAKDGLEARTARGGQQEVVLGRAGGRLDGLAALSP